MSLENAKQNLKEFGKELNLEGLAFDENHTCILGIDNTFSLHLTYEPNSDRLYLYSPILDGLPKEDKIRLRLYEALLEGSMLGGQMAGGGIGVAVPEELILMHAVLEMGVGSDPHSLRRFAPIFVDAVEKWREKAKAICEGRELPSAPAPTPTKPGERFIKI
ncbi:MAG TPA: CesT family type III secretion system chaperone [Rhabdochlamydiaceae bacterium]|nr:CesT family type III secretion system chaperone [Rhabdochlamydiaceae bacterium]